MPVGDASTASPLAKASNIAGMRMKASLSSLRRPPPCHRFASFVIWQG
jgi:hypothetical protein